MAYSDSCAELRRICGERRLKYHIETFGCQQNEHDSETIAGILEDCGFVHGEEKESDVIIFNTCAIRETAEEKILGRIGALKPIKKSNPDLIVGIGGCMSAQKHRAEEIFTKYPFVSFIFGANSLEDIPDSILTKINTGKRIRFVPDRDGISEGLPVKRRLPFFADISVMYGCDNFCSYCIVPYVRGRERSRASYEIIEEAKRAIDGGAKEIMLLGQNVNSYGKGLDEKITFAELLYKVSSLDGDFRVRFMTSHPKDATSELISVIASQDKICNQLHLPVQSGSSRILKEMNRHYDREKYLKTATEAKEKIKDLTMTSDIIVGFPGETEEDFEGTLSIVKQVGFASLFTFIYSPRNGTRAASMENQIPYDVAHERFDRLAEIQNAISKEKNEALVGKELKCLVTGYSETDKSVLAARTEGNRLIHFKGDEVLIGKFVTLTVDSAKTWSLTGILK